ncbi:MAG: heme ABC transporter ATP-binding protein [Verrucomicrobiota bacterium]
MNEAVLKARGITVRAGKKTLVEGVDLDLKAGEIQVLAGPNGAGKSTLLRVFTGENKANEGTVELDGRELGEWEANDLAKKRACLPQTSSLSFPFTIEEVVGIGRIPYLDRREEKKEAIQHALEIVALADRASEGYLHLSGGEKQRVHLARILAQLDDPAEKILLLDEPTSSLDLTFQQMVFQIARQWADAGSAVLLVLHDMNQVMHHADKVTMLSEGRAVASGPPREVLQSELVDKVYHVHSRWIDAGDHRLLVLDSP